jgi:GNAT superfamily N-acetyltransferase
MTEGSGAKDAPDTLNEEERALSEDWLSRLDELERRQALTWVGENLPEVRRSAYGQRSLYWALGIGFVVGLAAYAGGYALKSSVTAEPLGFVGDLLYTLGWALWTGVVVVIFLQVLPEAKRRGYKQLLDAYEAGLRDRARAEGDEASGNDEASTSA